MCGRARCGIVSHDTVDKSAVMSDHPQTPVEGESLHAPLARLLRPLVRLMVARGITFPALTDLLRELYVNVAEYDFAPSGGRCRPTAASPWSPGSTARRCGGSGGAGAPVSVVPATVSRTSADRGALARRPRLHRRVRPAPAAAAPRGRGNALLRESRGRGDPRRARPRGARPMARPGPRLHRRAGPDRARRGRLRPARRRRGGARCSITSGATSTTTSPQAWPTSSGRRPAS